MRRLAKTACAGFCAVTLGASLAQAQTPATSTYQDLLTQGFELKTVFVLSPEGSTRLATSAQPDSVMVALQKGPVTANCWITLGAWYSQNIGGLPCNVLH